ncbi:hypothetical protein ELI24_17110 [Rhizobium ruizarguesonis]|uniref:hypothetical protein n=1 Tax=Rhizobium ruizarguesonis TaxID=2081791 RepID=UPI001030E016|nr:hypothetical protein [Rhizobium ruizarguesonis]TAV99979.1 hypothetical protein ELI24_17110 [Rhizobium ruizarguesonis]
MRSNIEKVGWGIAIMVAATIVVPVVFGEPSHVEGVTGGDSWRNLIYDFQTLIAGIAAVLAAAFTIRTMEKTDRESERRHRQLMELTLRADRLKVSRSVKPFLPAIIQAIADVSNFIHPTGIDEIKGVGSQMVYASGVENYTTGLSQILNNPQLNEAYQLFEGKLAIDLEQARQQVAALQSAGRSLFKEIKTKSTAGDPEVEIFVAAQSRIKSLTIKAILLKGCLEEVRIGLSTLSNLYLSKGYPLRDNI